MTKKKNITLAFTSAAALYSISPLSASTIGERLDEMLEAGGRANPLDTIQMYNAGDNAVGLGTILEKDKALGDKGILSTLSKSKKPTVVADTVKQFMSGGHKLGQVKSLDDLVKTIEIIAPKTIDGTSGKFNVVAQAGLQGLNTALELQKIEELALKAESQEGANATDIAELKTKLAKLKAMLDSASKKLFAGDFIQSTEDMLKIADTEGTIVITSIRKVGKSAGDAGAELGKKVGEYSKSLEEVIIQGEKQIKAAVKLATGSAKTRLGKLSKSYEEGVKKLRNISKAVSKGDLDRVSKLAAASADSDFFDVDSFLTAGGEGYAGTTKSFATATIVNGERIDTGPVSYEIANVYMNESFTFNKETITVPANSFILRIKATNATTKVSVGQEFLLLIDKAEKTIKLHRPLDFNMKSNVASLASQVGEDHPVSTFLGKELSPVPSGVHKFTAITEITNGYRLKFRRDADSEAFGQGEEWDVEVTYNDEDVMDGIKINAPTQMPVLDVSKVSSLEADSFIQIVNGYVINGTTPTKLGGDRSVFDAVLKSGISTYFKVEETAQDGDVHTITLSAKENATIKFKLMVNTETGSVEVGGFLATHSDTQKLAQYLGSLDVAGGTNAPLRLTGITPEKGDPDQDVYGSVTGLDSDPAVFDETADTMAEIKFNGDHKGTHQIVFHYTSRWLILVGDKPQGEADITYTLKEYATWEEKADSVSDMITNIVDPETTFDPTKVDLENLSSDGEDVLAQSATSADLLQKRMNGALGTFDKIFPSATTVDLSEGGVSSLLRAEGSLLSDEPMHIKATPNTPAVIIIKGAKHHYILVQDGVDSAQWLAYAVENKFAGNVTTHSDKQLSTIKDVIVLAASKEDDVYVDHEARPVDFSSEPKLSHLTDDGLSGHKSFYLYTVLEKLNQQVGGLWDFTMATSVGLYDTLTQDTSFDLLMNLRQQVMVNLIAIVQGEANSHAALVVESHDDVENPTPAQSYYHIFIADEKGMKPTSYSGYRVSKAQVESISHKRALGVKTLIPAARVPSPELKVGQYWHQGSGKFDTNGASLVGPTSMSDIRKQVGTTTYLGTAEGESLAIGALGDRLQKDTTFKVVSYSQFVDSSAASGVVGSTNYALSSQSESLIFTGSHMDDGEVVETTYILVAKEAIATPTAWNMYGLNGGVKSASQATDLPDLLTSVRVGDVLGRVDWSAISTNVTSLNDVDKATRIAVDTAYDLAAINKVTAGAFTIADTAMVGQFLPNADNLECTHVIPGTITTRHVTVLQGTVENSTGNQEKITYLLVARTKGAHPLLWDAYAVAHDTDPALALTVDHVYYEASVKDLFANIELGSAPEGKVLSNISQITVPRTQGLFTSPVVTVGATAADSFASQDLALAAMVKDLNTSKASFTVSDATVEILVDDDGVALQAILRTETSLTVHKYVEGTDTTSAVIILQGQSSHYVFVENKGAAAHPWNVYRITGSSITITADEDTPTTLQQLVLKTVSGDIEPGDTTYAITELGGNVMTALPTALNAISVTMVDGATEIITSQLTQAKVAAPLKLKNHIESSFADHPMHILHLTDDQTSRKDYVLVYRFNSTTKMMETTLAGVGNGGLSLVKSSTVSAMTEFVDLVRAGEGQLTVHITDLPISRAEVVSTNFDSKSVSLRSASKLGNLSFVGVSDDVPIRKVLDEIENSVSTGVLRFNETVVGTSIVHHPVSGGSVLSYLLSGEVTRDAYVPGSKKQKEIIAFTLGGPIKYVMKAKEFGATPVSWDTYIIIGAAVSYTPQAENWGGFLGSLTQAEAVKGKAVMNPAEILTGVTGQASVDGAALATAVYTTDLALGKISGSTVDVSATGALRDLLRDEGSLKLRGFSHNETSPHNSPAVVALEGDNHAYIFVGSSGTGAAVSGDVGATLAGLTWKAFAVAKADMGNLFTSYSTLEKTGSQTELSLPVGTSLVIKSEVYGTAATASPASSPAPSSSTASSPAPTTREITVSDTDQQLIVIQLEGIVTNPDSLTLPVGEYTLPTSLQMTALVDGTRYQIESITLPAPTEQQFSKDLADESKATIDAPAAFVNADVFVDQGAGTKVRLPAGYAIDSGESQTVSTYRGRTLTRLQSYGPSSDGAQDRVGLFSYSTEAASDTTLYVLFVQKGNTWKVYEFATDPSLLSSRESVSTPAQLKRLFDAQTVLGKDELDVRLAGEDVAAMFGSDTSAGGTITLAALALAQTKFDDSAYLKSIGTVEALDLSANADILLGKDLKYVDRIGGTTQREPNETHLLFTFIHEGEKHSVVVSESTIFLYKGYVQFDHKAEPVDDGSDSDADAVAVGSDAVAGSSGSDSDSDAVAGSSGSDSASVAVGSASVSVSGSGSVAVSSDAGSSDSASVAVGSASVAVGSASGSDSGSDSGAVSSSTSYDYAL